MKDDADDTVTVLTVEERGTAIASAEIAEELNGKWNVKWELSLSRAETNGAARLGRVTSVPNLALSGPKKRGGVTERTLRRSG